MEPAFFARDLTDDELSADLAALKLGHYSGWRLVAETTYETGHRTGDSFAVYTWTRIWLHDQAGHEQVVTLRRPRGRGVWRRVPILGEATLPE